MIDLQLFTYLWLGVIVILGLGVLITEFIDGREPEWEPTLKYIPNPKPILPKFPVGAEVRLYGPNPYKGALRTSKTYIIRRYWGNEHIMLTADNGTDGHFEQKYFVHATDGIPPGISRMTHEDYQEKFRSMNEAAELYEQAMLAKEVLGVE